MSDEEFCETEPLRGHINCGGVKLNLDKLTFSLSCIYCDLEMLNIKDFGYHFQEHLVMSKAENELLLKNLETNSLFIEEETQIQTKAEESKQPEYEIEMVDESTEDGHIEMPSTNLENVQEEPYVHQVMGNEITKEHNNSGTQQRQTEQLETVDIGFDLMPDEEEDVPLTSDSLTCDVCDFKFSDVAILQKHRRHHNRCQICKKSFGSKVQLSAHLRTHKNRNKSILECECPECGEFFATSQALQIHQETHVPTTLHLCNTCGKSFQDERILRQHIKTHTSVRPFVCLECNMTFSKSHALMLHTKLHDVRKFSCSICRMTFAQNSGLTNHLKERHGNTAVKENPN